MHELIVAPFAGRYLVLRPGSQGALSLPPTRYLELTQAEPAAVCPAWLSEAVRQHWQRDLAGRLLGSIATIRHPSPYGFVRATYELNLGCNYDCEHCYLGLKRFSGMTWPQREHLLKILADAG